MEDSDLLQRITANPTSYGGKPIIRGRRLAVEHLLGMLASGATNDELLAEYDWLEPDDIHACLLHAHHVVARERVDVLVETTK